MLVHRHPRRRFQMVTLPGAKRELSDPTGRAASRPVSHWLWSPGCLIESRPIADQLAAFFDNPCQAIFAELVPDPHSLRPVAIIAEDHGNLGNSLLMAVDGE